MAKNKVDTSRKPSSNTRAADMRAAAPVRFNASQPWVRGASLAMPPAREGMVQRWIRFQYADGKPDTTNYSRKMREGWSPVDPNQVSKDWFAISSSAGKLSGLIVDGSILCERPIEISESRQEYMDGVTQMRTEALDHDLESTNRSTAGQSAFGPVKKESSRKMMREVNVKPD